MASSVSNNSNTNQLLSILGSFLKFERAINHPRTLNRKNRFRDNKEFTKE